MVAHTLIQTDRCNRGLHRLPEPRAVPRRCRIEQAQRVGRMAELALLARDVHRLAELFGCRGVGVQPRLGDPHAPDVDRTRRLDRRRAEVRDCVADEQADLPPGAGVYYLVFSNKFSPNMQKKVDATVVLHYKNWIPGWIRQVKGELWSWMFS